MICKVCGRAIANEHSNFCDYCGSPVGRLEGVEDVKPAGNRNQDMYQQNQPQWTGASNTQWGYGQPGMNQPGMNQQAMNQAPVFKADDDHKGYREKPMSFLQWLGIMLLPYIPFVGLITFIVMLCVWSFGHDTDETKKNWARARLVSGLIVTVIAAIYLVSMLKGLNTSGLSIEEYLKKAYY